MQLVGLEYSYDSQGFPISEKELVVLGEIGLEQIPAATSFVSYVAQKYEVSASGIWYTLKKLKQKSLVDFTEKGESYKPLGLTHRGISVLRSRIAMNPNRIVYTKQKPNLSA